MLTIEAGDAVSREQDFLDWLADHVEDWRHVYRVEVDGDQLTGHRYHAVDGTLHIVEHCPEHRPGEGKGGVCCDEPFTVPVSRPLPESVLVMR